MYHQLVHLLDLCTYCYQLHSQTLIWPIDPYYEQWLGDSDSLRNSFMAKVHQVATSANYPGVRGPSSLNSAPQSNRDLDPILSDYSQINPWRPSVTRPNREVEGWILYNTPREITDRINKVYMVRYDPAWKPLLYEIQALRPPSVPAGTDSLYCFEGGTGGIPRNDKAPAWSMMGLVLAREDDTAPAPLPPARRPYDLYIVFRGSRSGDPRATTALRTERGNPDWVTDMDFGFGSGTVTNIPEISAIGSVSPGFAASVHTMLPTIMECLEHIQALYTPYPPKGIYVTGHSLGAALAVHFTSAVLLGTTYGHNSNPTSMPANIQNWPWSTIQLVPFALPVVGGETFQQAFDGTLGSRRVYLQGDPVTQTKRLYPVGKAYAIDPEKLIDPTVTYKIGPSWNPVRHEPYNIRYYLIKDLQQLGFLPRHLPIGPLTQQPWKIFKNFKEMLAEPWDGNANGQVSQILGMNFNERLIQYLGVFEVMLKPGSQRQYIRKLHMAISNANINGFDPSILPLYDEPKQLFTSELVQFFGLCLFLTQATKETYARMVRLLTIRPYKDLTLI